MGQHTGPSEGVETAKLDHCTSGLEPGPLEHSMLTMLSTNLRLANYPASHHVSGLAHETTCS